MPVYNPPVKDTRFVYEAVVQALTSPAPIVRESL